MYNKVPVGEFKQLYPFLQVNNADHIYVIDDTYYIDESCTLKHLSGLDLPTSVRKMKLAPIVRELAKIYKFLSLDEELYRTNRHIISNDFIDYWFDIKSTHDRSVVLIKSISESIHEYINALFYMGIISFCSPLHNSVPERYDNELNHVTKDNYIKLYNKHPIYKTIRDIVKSLGSSFIDNIRCVDPKHIGQLAKDGLLSPQEAVNQLCLHDYVHLKCNIGSDRRLVVTHIAEKEELEALGFTDVFLHSEDNDKHPDRYISPERRVPINNTIVHFTKDERYPLKSFRENLSVHIHKDMDDDDYFNSVMNIIIPGYKEPVINDKKRYTLTHHHDKNLLKNKKVVDEIVNGDYTKVELMSIFGIDGLFL